MKSVNSKDVKHWTRAKAVRQTLALEAIHNEWLNATIQKGVTNLEAVRTHFGEPAEVERISDTRYKPNQCFTNAHVFASKTGGKVIGGWLVRQTDCGLRGVWHYVVRTGTQLCDPTPYSSNIWAERVFVPSDEQPIFVKSRVLGVTYQSRSVLLADGAS